ncbi:hypothetical protein A6V39_03255 [Candidatus Mycoplasma haematobovis]|uniref:Uncharacterized protein n=1 Tax=Candidatus Mycoplasma haematobovis TaxID=432608 RepID=A0A1A9QBD9_9MOLU|nr:hypothetical protein [Candidatus Mycoplasma haematobovis]OAL09902.1 hypothetical protein A6V39_03255 [Candidatus Mycoplasma haematobovis]
MSKLVPVIAGITGTTIIGTGGTYLLLTQNTTTIKGKFEKALIDFTKDTTLITAKLNKLKDGTVNSDIQKLKNAQTKAKTDVNSAKEDFQKACEEIYKSTFDKKESPLFKDFKEYCSWNVKDKVGDTSWADGSATWNTRFNKLNQNGTKPLSSSLKKVAKGSNTNGTELQKWCNDIAVEVFGGDDDLEFKDAKEHCKRTN